MKRNKSAKYFGATIMALSLVISTGHAEEQGKRQERTRDRSSEVRRDSEWDNRQREWDRKYTDPQPIKHWNFQYSDHNKDKPKGK